VAGPRPKAYWRAIEEHWWSYLRAFDRYLHAETREDQTRAREEMEAEISIRLELEHELRAKARPRSIR
jgi:hypothetical protein